LTELACLKEEGKVRWIGVSNFSVEQMKRAQAIAPSTFLQPPYAVVRREIEQELVPLTGAMTRERVANFLPEDWRRNLPGFQERSCLTICG
jgi:aryl-alcohol dehydrogenase-like predicted oxidoreductase